MSSPALTTNLLLTTIPKLKSTGLNWTVFLMWFQDMLKARGFWGHFDGSTVCPALSKPPKPEEEATLAQWNKNKQTAKSLLIQHIPDSTLICVHSKVLVKESWDAIIVKYTQKGAYSQTNLKQKFLEMKCSAKANVCSFMDQLCTEREKLATYGVVISTKDFCSTIISSLPPSLATFASAFLASALLVCGSNSKLVEVDPNMLILLIVKESDKHAA
jgi:hypothetical protein